MGAVCSYPCGSLPPPPSSTYTGTGGVIVAYGSARPQPVHIPVHAVPTDSPLERRLVSQTLITAEDLIPARCGVRDPGLDNLTIAGDRAGEMAADELVPPADAHPALAGGKRRTTPGPASIRGAAAPTTGAGNSVYATNQTVSNHGPHE